MASGFGAALRGWRERRSPQDVGLDQDESRRLRGLRRAELAREAGLSVDYVIRLEQGRARNPSPQVVAALARALRLDSSERDHLFRCANLLPPSSGNVPMYTPAGVQRLVHRLGENPVAVFSADWTIIDWNRMWTIAIGHPDRYGWEERNLVTGMFRATADGSRPDAIAAWPVRSCAGDGAEEASLVADLRVTAAAYPADPRLAGLIDQLTRTSPRFARLWSTGTAAAFIGDRKTVEHPVAGDIRLDLEILTAPGADLRIATYTAASGSVDARRLDELRARVTV